MKDNVQKKMISLRSFILLDIGMMIYATLLKANEWGKM